MASDGLKKTLSLNLESKESTDAEIVNVSGSKYIGVVVVCADPTFLITLIIFCSGKTFRRDVNSDPIFTVLPIETLSGISLT